MLYFDSYSSFLVLFFNYKVTMHVLHESPVTHRKFTVLPGFFLKDVYTKQLGSPNSLVDQPKYDFLDHFSPFFFFRERYFSYKSTAYDSIQMRKSIGLLLLLNWSACTEVGLGEGT